MAGDALSVVVVAAEGWLVADGIYWNEGIVNVTVTVPFVPVNAIFDFIKLQTE